MDGRLEPITLYKLKAFAKRRNRFIAIRGICAVLATILAAMTVVAFIDLLFVLADWARIALSLTGYGLALLVLYETSLRWFLRPADLRQLARMFEAGHDELDEKVLSAVELGQSPTKQVHDSEQLRALFQKRVALLVKNYRLKVLLPASLVRRWPIMAVAVVVLCIALTTIPELRYAQLMARAFAPTANIARVSSLKIRIVEPADPEPIVPQGDPLTIVAELSRPSDSEVFIETFADQPAAVGQPRQAPTIIQAEPLGRQRYAATVAVAHESLTYRVFVEKASTRQYTVRSQRRPHATKFHKTYHYPAYSRLEDKQITEASGDVKALQSSSVDLAIEVDQPVSDAELQIQIGEKRWFDKLTILSNVEGQTVKLTAVEPTLLRGKIYIVESGTYRVHLVARETKFENKFAPNYEIAALADLVPDVTIDKPKESVIPAGGPGGLPSDEIVRLEGAARDDLGLLDVEQLIRVNSGPWDRVALAAEAGKQYIIKKDWDLLPLELKPGDQVSTKLAATDLKGNRGESLVTQITIGSPGFSVKHLENREIRKHLQQSLQQLADASKQMNQDFQSFREQLRATPPPLGVPSGTWGSNPGDTARLHEISLRTQVSAQQVESLAQTAWNAMDDATRIAESRIEADDMILLGRMLSRLRHDALAEAQGYRRGLDNTANPPQEQIDRAADAAGRVEGLANQLRYSHQNILAHLQAQNSSREIHRLRNNYDDMLEQARRDTQQAPRAPGGGDEDTRKNAWRRLARQQSAAAKEQQIIEEMLDDLSLYAESGQAKQAERVRDKLANQRGQTEEILKQEEPGSKLTERGGDVRNNLREAADSLRNIEQTLRNQARKSRDELTGSLAMSADELAQLKWKVEDLARNQNALRDLQNRPNVEPQQMTQLRQQTAAASDLAEHRWRSASGQFSDRAAIEDVRPTPEYQLVADTADTTAAVNALHTTATDTAQIEQSATALAHIEKAYRVLESGHGFIEAGRALDEMTAQERWDFAQADAFTQPLNYWDDWEKRFRTLPNQLKAAELPGEIRKDLQKAIDSEPFRAVDAEAQQRDNPDGGRRPVAQQMETLARALADVSRQIGPYMEEARKVIAKYAPSLVDQLHAVSKLAEQAETETSQLTGKADEQPLDQVRSDAGRLLSRQQQLNDHIETIRGSLRRDANIQDLGRDEGRQRARDADDAIAMLRQPPPKAEDLLQEAALSAEKDSQKRALEQAVSQQNKLNDALDLITQHYENLEAGNPEQTRIALRQAEVALATLAEDMALAQNMDSRYDKLDEISRMAQMSPEELKALLEGQLPQNPPMQNELGQIVDSTIQQAANGISEMAKREKGISNQLDKIAEKQDRQNPQLAQVSDRLKDLAQKARQLADRARNLADNKVADAARRSSDLGAKAQQQFDSAKASLKQGDEKIPRDSSPPPSPSELAEKVEDFAGNVDQAKAELDNAAGKTQSAANDKNTDQANQAVQMTRDAGQEAQNVSGEARQIAAQLKDLARQRNDADRQIAQIPPEQNQFAQRAKDLAQQAGQLAKEDVPQAAQKAQQAGADASGNFDSAAQAAGDAARQMPTDFSAPPAALAEKVDDFAKAMDQAQGDLQSAVGKVNAAGNANPDQRSQAADQTRNAQRKAADLKKQGSDLARDLRETARRRSDQFEYTDRRQQEINQMAPEVIDDIARAAIHAERLSRPDAQTLRSATQAMQAISQNELPDAQHALDQAAHARQAQPPVDRAYDALADQLDNLAELQADAAQPQQGAQTDETAKWMARTLDQLEAAQMAQGSPQQAQPSPAAAARQTMNQALLAQQVAMAQARAQSQSQAQAGNRAASMFSSDRTSPQMPPETGEALPERLALRRGDWGKLRTLSATDLMEAGKETVAEDYREMVNMYFLVISKKARQKD